MKDNKEFAVFILTHGRADKVVTYKSLRKSGYTGRIIVLIDNEDKTADEYHKRFGEEVVVFDKASIAETFDLADNFSERKTIVFARNACFEIAEQMGIKWFVQLDDDYTSFDYRFDEKLSYSYKLILNLDAVFNSMLRFYQSIGAVAIAMAQGGDFIGGADGSMAEKVTIKRKCMNTFFCSTERKFQFLGRINEDVNTYTSLGSRGLLMLTVNQVAIVQKQTQVSSGGMTGIYLDLGTYVKSFYSVIFSPSSVKIAEMGYKRRRLHHFIRWKNTVPCIISESHKK